MFIDELDGKYSMLDTLQKEHEDGHVILPNNYPSEQNFDIFRDALSYVDNASI